ncbi:MAG: hypothetical protein P8X77_15470 [Maritimibacter sp.]
MAIAPQEIIGLAMDAGYDDAAAGLARIEDLSDPWLLAACLHSVGHLARRFGRYPGTEAARFWAEATARPEEKPVAGALEDAEDDILKYSAAAE